MALLGNIAVADRASMFPSGAAFLLSDKSKVSETVSINNGVVVEVAHDVDYVVARLPTNHAVSEIIGLAYEYVQQGLDLVSVTGKANLTIRNAADEHIIWWREGDKQIIRTVSTSTLNFDVPPVNVVVHDEHGNEVQGVAVEPTYHHAYRYYRLSQVTEDLYDAYRNMYLAFELLLSSKYPKGKEREIDWLERGLTGAETTLNLSAYLPTPSSKPIQVIIQTIYYNARLPLFHAKHGKPFYPPQSSQHRQAVAEALHLLTRIVLKMSEAWYNARYAGGGVYHRWVYDNIAQTFSKVRVLASEDSSEFDPKQNGLSHSRYLSGAWMTARLAPELQGTGGPVLLGTLDLTNNKSLNLVRRFEVVSEDDPLIAHMLENDLTLEEVDCLECQFNTRVYNIRQPRSLYVR